MTLSYKLAQWYSLNGRTHLPWRQTHNPYKIYLSEIMLQQTTVKTVLERFYFPFLQTFPTLYAVSIAQEQEVLKAWEGLGYYTRARNLYKTACLTQGTLPSHAYELIELPGIGKSTAHAIACFAFNEQLPILDANAKRVIRRLFGVEKEKELWEKAYSFLGNDAYIHNQALMDLGAMICTKMPQCHDCPLRHECLLALGEYHESHKSPKIIPIRHQTIIVYQYHNTFLLSQRKEKFLGGLYHFPASSHKEGEFIAQTSQIYSHFKLHVDIYLQKVETLKEGEWFTYDEILLLPLSGIDRKILEFLTPFMV